MGTTGASLTVAVPVYQETEGAVDNPTMYFVMARGQFAPGKEDVSLLPSVDIVYRSKVGLTGGIITTHHHLYLMTVSAGIAEDGNTIENPRIRTTGSLLGKYQLDDSFAFIYGLSYSYTFDRGLLLPLLGTHCSLGNNLKLHLVLPFSMDLHYEEARDLHFGFIIRANGDRVHIAQDAYGGMQSLPLFLKTTQIQSGFNVSIRLSGSFWLKGEAGIVRARKFAVGTSENDLLSGNIANAGYSTLTLRYQLGDLVLWGD